MPEIIGQTIKNRYRVDAFVGRGGMAEVYKVWDDQRSVYLAMKILHADLGEDKLFIRRFKREAQTLARLQHPNIVRFYGLEQQGRLAYMLMDYVEGSNLRQEIFDRDKPFTGQRLLEVLRPVCSALYYAHNMGYVHCDVKPANIMLHRNGTVLLSDFGIARMSEAATTTTMAGAGTPAYMAPEQVRGQDPTPQTDIYALGIVLYEMLTGGERPFTGERASITGSTGEKVRWEQVNALPVTPLRYNPGLPVEMEEVMLRCLAKEPVARYPSAIELLTAVEQALGEKHREEVNISSPTPIMAEMGDEMFKQVLPPESVLVDGQGQVSPPQLGNELVKENRVGNSKYAQRSHGGMVVGAILGVGILLMIGFVMITKQGATSVDRENSAAQATKTAQAQQEGQKNVIEMQTELATARTALARTLTPEGQEIYPTVTKTMTVTDTPMVTETPLVTATPPMGATRITEKDGMVSVYIPAGEFLVGSTDSDKDAESNEKPQHKVYLDGYWMDKTEVTNGMYQKCVSDGSCKDPVGGKASATYNDYYGNSQYANYPVVNVDWNQAQGYCKWAGGRLPSEAEWEKAARGTDGRKYPWGDGSPDSSLLNYNQQVGDTTEVGKYSSGASPYGLMDMAGNVWEWVNDWYDENYYKNSAQKNPTGPASGDGRVLRGGSWYNETWYVRAAYRNWYYPDDRGVFLGFRCAR